MPSRLREGGGRIATMPAPFIIGPRPAGQRDRQYLSAEVCWRYWETRMPVPWSDVHLLNNWHLSVDWVPIPPVPTNGRACHDEIECHRCLLRDDLYYDDRYARDEHDVRRASYFADTVLRPRRSREVRGRTRVRGLTPMTSPSPSPSPPPPPRMIAQEEARLMQCVMEDSMITHDEANGRA
ncbi:ADP-ribosylation factor-related protein 1 [Hordeum vulgare]|nr:ADP-ribosylation factor-related protein 1 [Hordeum vulgare]